MIDSDEGGRGFTPPPGIRASDSGQVERLQLELLAARGEASRLEAELDTELRELSHARERYFELYDLAPIGYCTVNSRGIIMEANLAASETVRVPRGALVLQPIARFVHPDDLELAMSNLRAALSGELVEGFELRLRRSDGKWIWVHVRTSFRGDPFGGTALVAFADITDSRLASLALRESEERYRSLFDNSQSGIAVHEVVLDAHGMPVDFRHVAVNRAFEAQTGILPEDAIGRRLPEVAPGGELLEAFVRVWRGGAPEELRIYSVATGRHLQVSVFAAGSGRLAAVKTDITALVEAEHAARSAHERTQLSLRAVRAGIWELDVSTGVSRWSDEIWPLLGLAPGSCEPSEAAWRERVDPEDRERVFAVMNRALAEDIEVSAEWRLDRRLGPTRWLMFRGGSEHNSRGEVTAYSGILLDVTDRRLRDDVRAFLAETLAHPPDGPFAGSLAAFLGRELGASFVGVYRLDEDGVRARSVAVWRNGAVETVPALPVSSGAGSDLRCVYPYVVCSRFPCEAVGVTPDGSGSVSVGLIDPAGVAVGMIVATGPAAFADSAVARMALELVSDRAASEVIRIRSESAARGRERTFRGLFADDPNAVALLRAVTGDDGAVTDLAVHDANPGFQRFLAGFGQDLDGASLRGLTAENQADAAVSACADVIRGGAPVRLSVGRAGGRREASVYWAGPGQCILTLPTDPAADGACEWSVPPPSGVVVP